MSSSCLWCVKKTPRKHQRRGLQNPRNFQQDKKFPTGPTERTPKPEYLIARSQLTERGPLGIGPIQFLMDKKIESITWSWYEMLLLVSDFFLRCWLLQCGFETFNHRFDMHLWHITISMCKQSYIPIWQIHYLRHTVVVSYFCPDLFLSCNKLTAMRGSNPPHLDTDANVDLICTLGLRRFPRETTGHRGKKTTTISWRS